MPKMSAEKAIARWDKLMYPQIRDGGLEEHQPHTLAVGFFMALGFDHEDAEDMAEEAKGTDEDEDDDEEELDEDDDGEDKDEDEDDSGEDEDE